MAKKASAKLKKNLQEFDKCIKKDTCDAMLLDEILGEIKDTYISPEIAKRFDTEKVDEQRAKLIEFMRKTSTIIIVAFSGGKDSIAMVLYLIYDLKIPRDRIRLYHHDVDGGGEQLFDWKTTPDYCNAFAKAMGVPIYYSFRKGGIVRHMFRRNEPLQDIYFQSEPGGKYHIAASDPTALNSNDKFPAVSADLTTRWCSSMVKIDVMKRILTTDPQYKENVDIVICTGERRAESTARSNYLEIEQHGSTTKKRNVIGWKPVIEWTDKEVWEIMKKHKIQPHPSYELGWSRCSCQTCIFNSSNVWASIKKISPEKIDRIAAIEKELNFPLYLEKATMPAEEYYQGNIDLQNLVAGTTIRYQSPHFQMVRTGKIVNVTVVNNETVYSVQHSNRKAIAAVKATKTKKGRKATPAYILEKPETITAEAIKKVQKVTYDAVSSIHDKVARGESDLTPELIEKWKDQATKKYDRPIIVDKWDYPLGAFSTENSGAS